MKKTILFILLALIIYTEVFSQSCCNSGITFSTQEQIDNFQINYPNCTEIVGPVSILYTDQINNLDGLSMVTSIGQGLVISGCYELLNLSGLESLVNIEGSFVLSGNSKLNSLEGLDNLISIGGSLGIYGNDSIIDLSSLSNITSIGSFITIINNKTLQSLSGLDNINEGTITNLSIYNNRSLANCNVQSICDYLVSPNGTINIYDNATGCNTPYEIAYECGITLNCLPFGNYYLRTQTEVDSFFINNTNCFDLKGSLNINGKNINNLSGLYGLESIETDLVVESNDSLLNFEGLNTLLHIQEDFIVGGDNEYKGNPKLQNFIGLDNLTKIGGYFGVLYNDSLIDFSGLSNLTAIGQFNIVHNYSLNSLTGLNNVDSIYSSFTLRNTSLNDLSEIINLTYVGAIINIYNNDSLNSLTGLDNINTSDIYSLYIKWNSHLSTCEVQSICEYIADSMNHSRIRDNYNGCNSKEEINEACKVVSSPNLEAAPNFFIYPNPAKTELYISILNEKALEVNIYNQLGQKVKNKKDPCTQIDISILGKGIYILEIVTIKNKLRNKLIIQ